MPKHICFFGIYDPEYSRNRILMEGLRRSGVHVTECRIDPRAHGRFRKYWVLYKTFRALPNRNFAALIVAFPGQSVVVLAKILYRGFIIFDAFTSVYDTDVCDRKRYGPCSIGALWSQFLDSHSLRLADHCLCDTAQHVKYFHEQYTIPLNKFTRVFVGVDPECFTSDPDTHRAPSPRFVVHFHGTFIPLQGVPYIMDAVRLLRDQKNIFFRIIGGTNTRDLDIYKAFVAREGLSAQVEFIDNVPLGELVSYIQQADVALGIFGDTQKALRVIPNKVFECAAMGKPIITADTPAIHEAFTDRKNVILCKPANSGELARAILELFHDEVLRNKISEAARTTARDMLTPRHVVNPLLVVLKKCNNLNHELRD